EDPRPEVYLPLGISVAVEQLGRDTLVAIGSYANLVRLDLNRQVEVHSTAAGLVQAMQPEGPMAALHPRHLILSLTDRDGFTRAVGERAAGSAAAPAESAEPVQDDWGEQGVRPAEG
ncbi:MAG: hypothetical protein JOZ41_13760, partial [Chloroflexi bacterium]|nr:hypothetical protein [Chloroflexota bacterium]